jgi:hypothetical protein
MTRQAQLNFALKALTAIIVAATLAMIGSATYGGWYDSIHHGSVPGDVPAHLGRSGGVIFYVRPWVRALYGWSMFLVLGGAALLVFVAYLAKRPARKD